MLVFHIRHLVKEEGGIHENDFFLRVSSMSEKTNQGLIFRITCLLNE